MPRSVPWPSRKHKGGTCLSPHYGNSGSCEAKNSQNPQGRAFGDTNTGAETKKTEKKTKIRRRCMTCNRLKYQRSPLVPYPHHCRFCAEENSEMREGLSADLRGKVALVTGVG
uniref:Uncharacterized protein n=1 Tax=Lotharella oceanica TaxID=641309 RepID=A0A7S2TIY1_9EUKA